MTPNLYKVIVFSFGFFGAALVGCRQENIAQPAEVAEVTEQAIHTFSLSGSKRSLTIQPEKAVFPQREGYSEFASYCSMCHSLLHISMQPSFPRQIWEYEVHKMVEKYNAPIDSATANKIIDYLVAIKGT